MMQSAQCYWKLKHFACFLFWEEGVEEERHCFSFVTTHVSMVVFEPILMTMLHLEWHGFSSQQLPSSHEDKNVLLSFITVLFRPKAKLQASLA